MTCPTCGATALPHFGGIMELCTHCSFLFVSNHERKEQQRAFIDQEEYDSSVVERLMKKHTRDCHDKKELYTRTAIELLHLSEKSPQTIRALDIGASGGFFLHELEQQGVAPGNLIANEMSPNYVEVVRRYFGFSTIRGNIEKLEAGESFDIITLFDVLEHVDDVAQALKRIHAMLTARGVLFLKLPNGTWARCKSFIPRFLNRTSYVKKQLYIEPGGHLNYWTRSNIHNLERQHFTLIETGFVQPTPQQFKKRFFLYNLWYRLNQLLGLDLYPEFYAIFRKN